MVFTPCRAVLIEADGTVTLSGIFNQVTALGSGADLSLHFDIVAILTGGLGESAVEARLIGPDGHPAWSERTSVTFLARHTMEGVQWSVRALVPPGDYELHLVIDDGEASVVLPFVAQRA